MHVKIEVAFCSLKQKSLYRDNPGQEKPKISSSGATVKQDPKLKDSTAPRDQVNMCPIYAASGSKREEIVLDRKHQNVNNLLIFHKVQYNSNSSLLFYFCLFKPL